MSVRSAWISAPILLLLGSVFPVHSDHFTITGSVLGPDGEAVAGATVQSPYLQTGPPRKYVWATVTTGADGAFELRVETQPWVTEHVLMASRQGFASGFARAEPGERVRIELGDEPTVLKGTVLDPKGKPLAGVEVAIRWVGFEYKGEGRGLYDSFFMAYPGSPLRAVSAEDGSFAIDSLPREAHVSITASRSGLASYESGGKSKPVSEPLALTMYPEARISGRVLRDGEPVAGVSVHASTAEKTVGSAVSRETGYSIGALPAGTYTVGVWWDDDYVAEARTGLTVEAGQHLEGIDLELIQGAIVEGRLTLEGSGLPATHVGIHVTHADTPKHVYGAKTDQEGRYRVRVAPGRVQLRLYDRSRASTGCQKVSLEVENGEHRTGVDFVAGSPVGECSVLVTGPDGAPVRGAQVWMITVGWTYPLPKPELTDERGRAPLRRPPLIPWGTPSVFAQHPELELAGVARLARAGGTTEVRLKPGAYAVAEVVDVRRKRVPLGGARVSVFADGIGIPVAYRANEEGMLCIGPLPPGVPLMIGPDAEAAAMAIEEWGQGGMPAAGTLRPGETVELPPLRLNPEGRRLAGTVADRDEKPVAAALVFCMATVSLEPLTVKTDDEGRFEMTGLKSRDTVTVIAFAADGKRACGMLCDPELAFEPVFTLEPAGVIEGTVYQPDGKPKARAVVHVQCTDVYARAGSHEGLILMGNVVADERGHYRIEGMVPGIMYSISSHDYETGQHGWADQFVASGGPDPIVMEIQLEERR